MQMTIFTTKMDKNIFCKFWLAITTCLKWNLKPDYFQPYLISFLFCYWTVQGYANEAALESYREINTAKVWAGVVFDTSSNDYSTTIPNQVHYKLRVTRLNPQDSWQTANTFPFFRTPGARDDTNEGGTPSECFKLRGTNYSVLSVMRNKKLDLRVWNRHSYSNFE